MAFILQQKERTIKDRNGNAVREKNLSSPRKAPFCEMSKWRFF